MGAAARKSKDFLFSVLANWLEQKQRWRQPRVITAYTVYITPETVTTDRKALTVLIKRLSNQHIEFFVKANDFMV